MNNKNWGNIFIGVMIMGILNFFFCEKERIVDESQSPWNGLPSIYSFVQQNAQNGRLPEDFKLPDEERRYEENEMRFVPGGFDGAFGHHGNPGVDKRTASKIAKLVKSIARNNRLSEKIELYRILVTDNVIDFIDPALEKIAKISLPIEPYLHSYAKWLAEEAPDRGPVKFGIALLGLIANEKDVPIFMTLGKHEEFTLYSTIAICNTMKDPTMKLWELAKSVDGWGKIHIVERIYKTNTPEIKKWLLLEGYKNSVMYEYLAYPCAVGGELHHALAENTVSMEVLISAGEILEALITGGPAKDINDYEYAQLSIRKYLENVKRCDYNINIFNTAILIKGFLSDNDTDWDNAQDRSWNKETRKELITSVEEILGKPGWNNLVTSLLSSEDETVFWEAKKAAHHLEIDISEICWKRLIEKPHDSGRWFDAMLTAEPTTIDRIVDFALQKIPLDSIATGPGTDLGLGPEYNMHSCLDFILQDLGKFPGKGFPLISTGLKSPVIRNRNMALKALEEWGNVNWPANAGEILSNAYANEPEADVRKFIKDVMEGKKHK
jgi:hypothetical protein